MQLRNKASLTSKWLRPASLHREPATRCARLTPGSDTMGTPAHSASVAVVCALNSGVSRNRSARPLIKNSRSLGNMSLMTMRLKSTPSASHSRFRFFGPSTASNFISHSLVDGTARMIRIHTFHRYVYKQCSRVARNLKCILAQKKIEHNMFYSSLTVALKMRSSSRI